MILKLTRILGYIKVQLLKMIIKAQSLGMI